VTDDILRVLSVVVWVVASVILFRSDVPRRQWSLSSWYVLATAIAVTGWRVIIALRNLDPTYIPSDLFRFIVRSVQPSLYVMLGFALILAVRAHPHDR